MQESSQKAWHDCLFQNVCIEPCMSRGPFIPALVYSPKIQLYSTVHIYIFILEPNKARKRGNIWLYGSSVLSLWGEGGKPTSKSAFYPLPFSILVILLYSNFWLQMFCSLQRLIALVKRRVA
jgi:hypothetical protein